MPSIVAGLDFGTSNSAIGFATPNDVRLHRFEHGAQATPTALFFDEDDNALVCGHEAETRFLGGYDGRYLRALKSILGTSLADESTRMGKRPWPFRTLLSRFITHMKEEAERAAGVEITRLVAGRPVRFVDEDDGRDQAAEALLHKVLQDTGFEEVQFVYEPVAARPTVCRRLRTRRSSWSLISVAVRRTSPSPTHPEVMGHGNSRFSPITAFISAGPISTSACRSRP